MFSPTPKPSAPGRAEFGDAVLVEAVRDEDLRRVGAEPVEQGADVAHERGVTFESRRTPCNCPPVASTPCFTPRRVSYVSTSSVLAVGNAA
jgi:hypothetical protein